MKNPSQLISNNDDFKNTDVVGIASEVAPRSTQLIGKCVFEAAKRFYDAFDKNRKNTTKLREPAIEYIGLLDDYPDIEKDIREPLKKLSSDVKDMQDNIFSTFINNNGAESRFIKKTILPAFEERLSLKNIQENPTEIHYFFCDKLNEKNEQGNYVVSDKIVANFVAWYHAQIKTYETENNYKLLREQKDYYKKSISAIKRKLLPESLGKDLELLNVKSKGPIYTYIDIASASKDGDFSIIGGTYVRDAFRPKQGYSEIQLNLAMSLYDFGEITDKLSHELTHFISGEAIEFDGKNKATRIFKEGLTEGVKDIIRKAPFIEPGDIDYFGGEVYEVEREVLDFLKSGGKREIDIMDFFEAYAEQDEQREALRYYAYNEANHSGLIKVLENIAEKKSNFNKENSNPVIILEEFLGLNGQPRKLPTRYYGPAQEKLISELLEAFPECEDLAGLGEMIEQKFDEFNTER